MVAEPARRGIERFLPPTGRAPTGPSRRRSPANSRVGGLRSSETSRSSYFPSRKRSGFRLTERDRIGAPEGHGRVAVCFDFPQRLAIEGTSARRRIGDWAAEHATGKEVAPRCGPRPGAVAARGLTVRRFARKVDSASRYRAQRRGEDRGSLPGPISAGPSPESRATVARRH